MERWNNGFISDISSIFDKTSFRQIRFDQLIDSIYMIKIWHYFSKPCQYGNLIKRSTIGESTTFCNLAVYLASGIGYHVDTLGIKGKVSRRISVARAVALSM